MENSFKIDGRILCMDDTRPAKEGSTMLLRDFWLEQVFAGESNHIKCQLKGNNCLKLDKFLPNDEVVISFSLQGPFGGAKYKEGHPISGTNPLGLTGFSPNINVWHVDFANGFVRQPNQPNTQQTNNTNQQANNKPNTPKDPREGQINPSTGKIWTHSELDDLPF